MSKLLERIIRDVLNEGQIRVSVETITAEDTQIIKDVQNRLKIDPAKRTFENFDGLRIVLQRIGGRVEDEAGNKTYGIDKSELQSQVLLKLNSLVGIYKPMTNADYVWLITTDLRLNDKRDARKPKEERIFARYSVTAIYIQKSLISKEIKADAASGYLDTLRGGAMVFDLDTAVPKWIRRSTPEVSQTAELVNAPYGAVSFGAHDPLVKSLYLYFNLVGEFMYELTNDYNCELKGAVQQFQIENGLPATGNYDEATSKFARGLQSPTYVFKDKEAVKRLADSCKLEQTTTERPKDITVPPGGFKVGEKQNVEFYKVQKLMLLYFENILANPTYAEKLKKLDIYKSYTALKKALETTTNQGNWGQATSKVVTFLKNGFKPQMPDNGIVDNEFVDKLKTALNK
jgi:peptidoglycan hydrolase-like protein with peptidoglycan-binding domain